LFGGKLLSFLELLEADDGSVEFAFDGSDVTESQGEAAFGFLSRFVGDEVNVEIFGFGFSGPIETPHAAGDFMDDLDFERVLRSVLLDEAGHERIEFGAIFSGQDDVATGEAMLKCVC
jgi:hypothetical protein